MSTTADTPAVFANSSTPLAGIPLGIKEVFAQSGVKTSAGSKMIESFAPPYNATLIEQLKQA
jgi:aspartyl-tRNA(Asn)/glutamyl-tRNA(Gln) amidotransferase subunit A